MRNFGTERSKGEHLPQIAEEIATSFDNISPEDQNLIARVLSAYAEGFVAGKGYQEGKTATA